MSVADATVDFPAAGLVAVLGENLAGGGQLASIGAGKTAIGELMARMLFGLPGRFANLNHSSRHEAGDMYARLEARFREQEWTIEYGYKCAELSETGEGLRLTVDGTRLEHGHVRETRAALTAALQLGPELAAWTTYLDGTKLRFDQLTQAQSVELILLAMRQPAWHDRQAKVKKPLDQAKLELAITERNLATHRDQLASVEHDAQTQATRVQLANDRLAEQTRQYDAKLAEWTATAATLQAAHTAATVALDQVTTEWQLATVATTAAQPPPDQAAADRLERGQAAADQWREAVRELRQQVAQHSAGVARAEDTAQRYATGGKCAHCGTVVQKPDPAHTTLLLELIPPLAAELAHTRARLADAEQSHASAVKWCAAAKAKLDAEATARKSRLQAATAQVVARHTQAKLAAAQAEAARRAHAQAKPDQPDRREADRAQVILESAQTRHQGLLAGVADLGNRRTEWANSLAVAEYWHKAFGPAGIPNLVLKTGIGALNRAAQLVGQAVAGGAVGLEFQTEVELVGGEAKPRLTTVARQTAGATRLAGGSKGEQGLANLLAAEAITAVAGNPVGFRWLDEAVNSQDHHVRRQIYQYLRRQAAERQLLNFVVDHHPDLEASADHVLIATKDATGATTYRWRT